LQKKGKYIDILTTGIIRDFSQKASKNKDYREMEIYLAEALFLGFWAMVSG